MAPTNGIPININRTQNNECRRKPESHTHQKDPSAVRMPFKDCPEAIATSHHPDPGQHRICGHESVIPWKEKAFCWCKMSQIQAARSKRAAETPSSRLCSAIIATLTATITRIGQ